MSLGPLGEPPIACTLPTLAAAKEQVLKWKAFDADYALESIRAETSLTVRYAKVADSIKRLRELVDVEKDCCAFVQWSIDEDHRDLRLIVTGAPFQLSALNVGSN